MRTTSGQAANILVIASASKAIQSKSGQAINPPVIRRLDPTPQNQDFAGAPVRRIQSKSGQATVEYLIVALAIIAIIAALGALSNAIGSGMFVEHAADSASHSLTTNTAGAVGDVLLY